MKIGNYEISSSANFFITGDDNIPISLNAGGDIPDCAIWINGKPKPYELPADAFILPCSPQGFQDLVMASQAEE